MPMSYYFRMINHPDELKLQFQAISEIDSPSIAHRLHSDHEYFLSYFIKVLKKGIAQGVIRKDLDVKTIAWLFDSVGMMISMARILKFEKEYGEREVRKVV